jgi:hypothetical protein
MVHVRGKYANVTGGSRQFKAKGKRLKAKGKKWIETKWS